MFNYEEIIQSILDGKVNELMFVTVQKETVDSYGDYDVESIEVVFAGTTVDECRRTIDTLVSNCEVDRADEQYEFFASRCYVDASYLEEYDAECDDAEEAICGIINEAAVGDCDNVGSADWSIQTVGYTYESLEGSILVYWRWHRYVDYAREAIRFEYCEDSSMTSQRCIQEDSTSAVQVTCLVTAEEVKDCSTASDLLLLIQQRFDDMGKWKNDMDVEAFLSDLYHDQDVLGYMYSLPKNDL